MKITDLRIGDRVQNKTSKFPMTVVAIFSYLGAPDDEGAVYLDFEGNGDVLSEIVENLELCEPRYKLPEWKKLDSDSIISSIDVQLLELGYVIDKHEDGGFNLFLYRTVDCMTDSKRICRYPTLEEAKEAAEKHYNELVSELIEKLTSAPLLNEESKTQNNN